MARIVVRMLDVQEIPGLDARALFVESTVDAAYGTEFRAVVPNSEAEAHPQIVGSPRFWPAVAAALITELELWFDAEPSLVDPKANRLPLLTVRIEDLAPIVLGDDPLPTIGRDDELLRVDVADWW